MILVFLTLISGARAEFKLFDLPAVQLGQTVTLASDALAVSRFLGLANEALDTGSGCRVPMGATGTVISLPEPEPVDEGDRRCFKQFIDVRFEEFGCESVFKTLDTCSPVADARGLSVLDKNYYVDLR